MKMGKYINVEKQLVRLYRLGLDNEEVIKLFLLTACEEDVEKVRHGRWITPKGYSNMLLCSECDTPYEKKEFEITPNYCPRCGAKMDEVEK